MQQSDNYYFRTATDHDPFPVLQDNIETDVCVIGGGLAGLSVAMGLVERGRRVALLESKCIGFGASGRNGGFVLSGYSMGAKKIAEKAGLAQAQALYRIAREARFLIRRRIEQYNIECAPVEGHLRVSWFDDPRDLQAHVDYLRENFDENTGFWSRAQVREVCRTSRYYDGQFYPDCFHMHPLNYALGLARAIKGRGGKIFENSMALKVDEGTAIQTVHTAQGTVKASHIVFCGSSYFNGLDRKLARSCLSIRSDVMVTEPIAAERLASAITRPYAIRDTRWTDDYYRLLPDNRILWGGGCSLMKAPSDLKERMLRSLVKIYPQLDGIKAQTAWSGLMGFTVSKMPVFSQLRPGIWACTNVGGQGLNVTTVGGEVIASAIVQGDETYRLFDPFRPLWAGGALGPLVAQGVYHSWEIRDRIHEVRLACRNRKTAA